jgi:hypothetical protein
MLETFWDEGLEEVKNAAEAGVRRRTRS